MGNTPVIEEDDVTRIDNLKFYSNQIESVPNGDYVSVVHKEWFGNWELLEDHHSYIQWIFPIREGGMNGRSQPLSLFEASEFRKSPELQLRLIKSYELMLDFYGLVLVDKITGKISRNPKTYEERFNHLNSSFHNYLRITRIMKCLGMVGLEHYKKQFLNHMILEVLKEDTLDNAQESCIKYWIPTMRKDEDIDELDKLVKEVCGYKVSRDGKDGRGDERGDNWSTKYYEPTLIENMKKFAELKEKPFEFELPDGIEELEKLPPFEMKKSVTTFDKDPYEDIHKKFEQKLKEERERRKKRFVNFRRHYESDSDDDKPDDSEESDKEEAKKREGNKRVKFDDRKQ